MWEAQPDEGVRSDGLLWWQPKAQPLPFGGEPMSDSCWVAFSIDVMPAEVAAISIDGDVSSSR